MIGNPFTWLKFVSAQTIADPITRTHRD